MITRDSDTPSPSFERRDRRWDDGTIDDAPAPSPELGERAFSWPLIGLFLFATALGGAGVALLGLIPDVLL